MSDSAEPTQLPPALLARSQEAKVAADEATARKASADAETSLLTLAQTKYKALVPDFSAVTTDVIDDKSTGVAFSGLASYSALGRAATVIADKISPTLSTSDGQTILVTSQSDLLTDDLLSIMVKTGMQQLKTLADDVLRDEEGDKDDRGNADSDEGGEPANADVFQALGLKLGDLQMLTRAAGGAIAGAAGAGALAAAGGVALGPLGLAAAAASAIPSIISLFSSTTTVKAQSESLTDLATTTAVVSALSDSSDSLTIVHEDFRLAPIETMIGRDYADLALKRTALLFKQERDQLTKNGAGLKLARAQQQLAARQSATPVQAPDAGLTAQIADATAASADAAARLSVITSAISAIDAFTAAVNATAAGTRSPLAIASLNELLHTTSEGRIDYVLSVKGLSTQAEEYTKDRRIGPDTYTTLADSAMSYMLYDTKARKIISSGLAVGGSSVGGHVGELPDEIIDSNGAATIGDQTPHDQRRVLGIFGGRKRR